MARSGFAGGSRCPGPGEAMPTNSCRGLRGKLRLMGLTHIEVVVANPGHPRKAAQLRFLVDSGAVYSVVPGSVLRRLGIKARTTRSFILADGSTIKRRVGQALFRFNGQEGASPVIFGQKDDSLLLGT